MISVLIPVYNVAEYLQSCIDSLLAQTYQDIEFIFINDASTDNSLEILKKNKEQNIKQIRIIDLKQHVNLGGARNIGLISACGEYIGFVDPDDMVSPNMYEQLHAAIETSNADVAFVMHSSVNKEIEYSMLESLHDKVIPRIRWDYHLIRLEGRELNDADRNDLHVYPIGGIWSGLWRKSVIVEYNVWWPKPKYEDNYWQGLMLCYVRRVSFVQNILYYYRINPSSTTHKRNQEYTLDRIDIERHLLDEVKHRQLYYSYYDAWEYLSIKRYVLNTFRILLKNWDFIPYKYITDIVVDVKAEFPNWRKNRYYRTEFSFLEKVFCNMVMGAPRITALLYKFFRCEYANDDY